jgi:hypothetical protein
MIMVNASDKDIKVDSTEGFPDTGYLLLARFFFPDGGGELDVQYEFVYYGEKEEKKFKELERGQFSTSPQDFEYSRMLMVYLVSLPINNKSDYEDEGRVQVDNEWFVYDLINEKNGALYMVRSKNDVIEEILGTARDNPDAFEDPNPMDPDTADPDSPDFKFDFRARNQTLRGAHDAGAEVVPVFKTKDPICGRFDVVTMITQQGSAVVQRNTAMVNWADLKYVAFTECIQQAFVLENSRLLKFPSGETPGQLDGTCTVGASASGEAISGVLDEVKFGSASRGIYRLAKHIGSEDTEMDVTMEAWTQATVTITQGQGGKTQVSANITALPDCGVLRVGDELIGYSELDGNTLGGLRRGLLGTEPAVHDNGDYIMNLAFMTASALTDGVDDSANALSLKSVSQFPSEGYVLINNEMIGFHRKDGGSLVIPSENPDSPGLFRAAFGSIAEAHSGGDIAVLMPYRYFDGYRERSDVPEMAYFQTSFAARGAYWERISWEQDIPFEMYQKVKVYARVNGKPDWNAEPTNKPGGLWLFEQPAGDNLIGTQGDFIEVRVYFTYERGAFQTDAWKATPALKNFLVRFAQPLRVLSHRELTR